MMLINMVLLHWFKYVFLKNLLGREIKKEIISNKALTEELQKPIIKIVLKIKV